MLSPGSRDRQVHGWLRRLQRALGSLPTDDSTGNELRGGAAPHDAEEHLVPGTARHRFLSKCPLCRLSCRLSLQLGESRS